MPQMLSLRMPLAVDAELVYRVRTRERKSVRGIAMDVDPALIKESYSVTQQVSRVQSFTD